MDNNKRKPIEKEFFIMETDVLNNKHREYPKEIVDQWIKNLESKLVKNYPIEFGIVQGEKDLKVEFVKDSLDCGIVTKLWFEGNKLYGMAKFKIKGQYADEMYADPNYFDDLTVVPKGKGITSDNKVHDYTLIGFNLLKKAQSPFTCIEPKAIVAK